jgi:nucleotide-binding universal stress UspA family protein
MSFNSLLVHLNSDERSKIRLKVAADLARARGAKLTGLFAQPAAPNRAEVPTESAAVESRADFLAATAKLDAEWIDLGAGDESEIVKRVTFFARHFDLIVMGQPRPDDALTPPDLAEHLIVNSGRPVLVLPYAGEFKTIGKRPIFAWADSASSARGFADAMGLVMPRVEALVLGLSKSADPEILAAQKDSLNLAVAHLAANKICAYAEQLALGDIGLMDALLNRVADHGADLLALGGFGGGGYPLFSRGSGSRYMLRHMTTPVLFAH